jgi:transposase-like protein
VLASHLRTKVKERSRWRHFRYLRSTFSAFVAASDGKYPKAAERLQKDRDALLAFHDLPAPQWQHIRTTNPTESTFATVRLRTAKTRGCFSRQSILSSVYRLGLSAEKRWRRLRGFKHLADVIDGVKFIDGVRAKKAENSRAAA